MFIFICFILLIITQLYCNPKNTTGDILVKSFLIFSGFIVLFVETLSLFKALNLKCLVTFWSIFSIVLLLFILKKRKQLFLLIHDRKLLILQKYSSLTLYEKLLIFVIAVFLFILFVQGIFYPPNNWDSLTYHMSRIIYWIGNESVVYFPTNILRHLYQPPFGEYFILNISLLQGNDIFANSVQLLFLVACVVTINSILKLFNVSFFNRCIILLLVITIPSVALQASTTKNDIICAFFVLTTIYFGLLSTKTKNIENFIFIGLSVGLGMLTKGTFYIYAFPILLILFFCLIKKDFNIKIVYYAIIAIFIALILNIGYFTRNYSVNKNILQIDKVEGDMFSNNEMNPTLLTSNILKNSGLHLGYPINTLGEKFIRKIHTEYLKTPINNPETNYLNIPYEGKIAISTHEDLVPNTYHFILVLITFLFSIVIALKNLKKHLAIILMLIVVFFQFLLFCAYLKWQPWHTRLQIPLFIGAMLMVGLLLEKNKYYKYFVIISIPLALYSFYFNINYNNLRPFSKNWKYTKDIEISDPRYKKYFANQLHLYPDYKEIMPFINDKTIHSLGLALADWEYPLLKNFYHDQKKVYSIYVNNVTANINQDIPPSVDCIVSNKNAYFLEFKNKKYYNKTPNNKNIWCYK